MRSSSLHLAVSYLNLLSKKPLCCLNSHVPDKTREGKYSPVACKENIKHSGSVCVFKCVYLLGCVFRRYCQYTTGPYLHLGSCRALCSQTHTKYMTLLRVVTQRGVLQKCHYIREEDGKAHRASLAIYTYTRISKQLVRTFKCKRSQRGLQTRCERKTRDVVSVSK